MASLSEDKMTLTLDNGDVYTSTCEISKSSSGGKRNNKKESKNKTRKQEGGKRKLSGYMKFANKMRPQLMKENPGMKVPQMGKKLGEMWGKLSDAEKKSHA
jgi:high mobility group protein B1